MNITLDKKDATNASVKILLQEEDYRPKVEAKVKEYGKKAQIKGFRPGKVPPGLIRKMYGKSILVDEINGLLSSSLNDYIREQKLPIVGEPLPAEEEQQTIDWDTQKEFEFSFQLGLVPEFSYDAESLTAKRYQIDIEEATIDEIVENVRQRNAAHSHPETSEKGDALSGILRSADGSFEKSTELATSAVKEGQEELFVGLKAEDTVTFTPAEVFEEGTWSDQTGTELSETPEEVTFTVSEIHRDVPAELNEDLYRKVLGPNPDGTPKVTTEEEFRAEIKKLVSEDWNKQADQYVDQQLRQQLVNTTEMELPKEFLRRWLLATNQEVTEEQLDREFDAFLENLKWQLISNKIAEANEIKVETPEVQAAAEDRMRKMYESMGMEPQEEMIKMLATDYLRNQEQNNFRKLFEELYYQKVFAALREKATLEEQTVSNTEFQKILQEESAA
ncbi:trigger factor [Catalinimonas alkaloidigena]|uniref:Trigger factor n=1 Tax=Catalinimonas alkaloidigena TaxID=1075417 RepID=A0A1G9GW15_9BACT|nr:trigger factor [Catalinimonas alkaloidigena]SDL04871.1 trigger factor [Catalinimonas alkaloidigena]